MHKGLIRGCSVWGHEAGASADTDFHHRRGCRDGHTFAREVGLGVAAEEPPRNQGLA